MLALMQNPIFTFYYWLVLLALAAVVVSGWTWLITTRNRPAPRPVTLHALLVDWQATIVAIVALTFGYRVKWTNGYVYCFARR